MKVTAVDVRQYLKPVIGSRPWRVKLGVGSFLSFEFGSKIKTDGHVHGQWHLWIYQSNWRLFHGNRELIDSDTDRKRISICVRRLEGQELSAVDFDANTQETTFLLDGFRLVVSPADYLKDADDRDHYWMLFMPDNEVLTVGPAGVRLEQEGEPHHA
jgi:hypothetical protein